MRETEMRFAKNYIRIKSNWFDEDGIISKIGVESYFFYLCLYKFFIPQQETDCFNLSVHDLKKYTLMTEKENIEILKKLIKYKIIKCSITRWDRYNYKNSILIYAIDTPLSKRAFKNGKEVDVPLGQDDNYIIIDMKLMQEYMNRRLSLGCYSLYAILSKYSNNIEHKSDVSVNTISERLGITNYKSQKYIRELNKNKLLYSKYVRIKSRTRFEHRLCKRFKEIEIFKETYEKMIDKNIDKWDNKIKK